MKTIKSILIYGQGWKHSSDCQIKEILKNGEMAHIIWYEQGSSEFNSKYVIEVVYEIDG